MVIAPGLGDSGSGFGSGTPGAKSDDLEVAAPAMVTEAGISFGDGGWLSISNGSWERKQGWLPWQGGG